MSSPAPVADVPAPATTTDSATLPAERGRTRGSRLLRDLAVVAATLVLWQVLAITWFAGTYAIVAPTAIVGELQDNFDLYARNLRHTGVNAIKAFFWGNLVALVLAAIVLVAPITRRVVLDVAFIVSCLPLVALAPLLRVAQGPGELTPVTLGALAVIYTSLTAALVGLRSADLGALDVVKAGGRGRWFALVHVRARAAVPALFAGLQISAPAAFLGALVGEFAGSASGFGQLTIRALATLDPNRVWTVAAVSTAVAVAAFATLGALGRWLTPWAATTTTVAAPAPETHRLRRALLQTLVSVIVVIAGWVLILRWSDLDAFFAKGPEDVWAYLFSDASAPGHRRELLDALGSTLVTAGLGFLVGLVGAVALAGVLVAVPPLQRVVVPVAVALRSVPIVATTPLVILLLGRGVVGAVAIVAILSFFPTLVSCTAAMQRVPGQVDDVMRVYAAGPAALFFRARLPSCLPALMASARVAVPASLLGATVAEWLATGEGTGNLMTAAAAAVRYDTLWACVAALVLVAVVAYGIVAAIEAVVLGRFAPEQRS